MYNGTNFIWLNQDNNTTYTPMALGFGYGTCTTAEAATDKVATLTSYVLIKGGMVSVKFTNAVPASATLNINGKGAKYIYYHGTKILAGIINANDIATFVYDGAEYQLIAIDNEARIKANASNIAKNAAAIQKINDKSSGAVATSKGYTDSEINKVSANVTANTNAITAINNASTGAVATANKHTDTEIGKLNTKISSNTSAISTLNNSISAINNTSTGILARAKSYTNSQIPSSLPANGGNAATADRLNNKIIIGTNGATYNSILDFAIASNGYTIATIVTGNGYPSDAPEQNEALVSVMGDYYCARKIVTWMRFSKNYPPCVYKRSIFSTGWHDDKWNLSSYGAIKHEQITASTDSDGCIKLPTSATNYINAVVRGYASQLYTSNTTGLEMLRVYEATTNQPIPNTVVSLDIIYFDYTYGGN